MLLKSSITQVSHTSSAITPDTAATRPAMRNTSSIRLISFTGGSVQISTMNGSAAIKGSATVLLGLGLFSVALPMPTTQAAQGAECPEQVRFQIDALYRWQLERQQQSGPIQISSQRQRFTPQLYRLLQRAYDLTPADGRFVDFDLFSGSQVNTFSATLQGCRQEQVDLLSARVAVQAGLVGRRAELPMQLHYVFRQSPSAGWRIADIIYPDAPSFRLTTYLRTLLEDPS